jgi:hypothetical protein
MRKHVIEQCQDLHHLHGEYHVGLVDISPENLPKLREITDQTFPEFHRTPDDPNGEPMIGMFIFKKLTSGFEFVLNGCIIILCDGTFYLPPRLNSELSFLALDEGGHIQIYR